MSYKNLVGNVFDIQRFSVHDGPGIRTTVFLKGCPLRCKWCHNPESNLSVPQLSYNPEMCIGCGSCSQICVNGCHKMINGMHVFDRDLCKKCFKCVNVCYKGALKRIGNDMYISDILKTVLKDKNYYKRLDGGLTVSGGEPLLQSEFVYNLLSAAKEENIHTSIETCGYADWEKIEPLIDVTDLFLYDVKETNSNKHYEFTGVPNKKIINNLRKLDKKSANIIMRCVIVPGYNDREDHFKVLADLANELENLLEINIMPYHPYGEVKGERVGYENSLGIKTPKNEIVEKWLGIIRAMTNKPVVRG